MAVFLVWFTRAVGSGSVSESHYLQSGWGLDSQGDVGGVTSSHKASCQVGVVTLAQHRC